MATVRDITPEEAERLLSEAKSGVSVPTGPMDPSPGPVERATTGLVRGATLGFGADVPPESGSAERLQRTIPEAVGGTGVSMAALLALAGMPGRVGRWARRMVATARQHPARTAVAAGGGTLGAGVGAGVLPDMVPEEVPWHEYSEPVGAIMGGIGGSLASRPFTSIGTQPGSHRRVADTIVREANPSLDPNTIPRSVDATRSEVQRVLGPSVDITAAQALNNPGLANVENAARISLGDASRLARVRQGQSDAALAGIRAGTGAADPAQVSQSVRNIAADKIREAATAAQSARAALDVNERIVAPRLSHNARLILNHVDPGTANTDIPAVARRIVRDLDRSKSGLHNRYSVDTLINFRRELQREMNKPGATEALRERSQILIRDIDDAILTNSRSGDRYQAFINADDNLSVISQSYGPVARSGGSDVVNQFIDTPTSFRELRTLMGNNPQAMDAARDILEHRMIQSVVNSQGAFDPSRARSFVNNKNNMELIEEAFGKDHANRVRAITNIMSRLDTSSMIPPGAAAPNLHVPGKWENINRVFRRPLNPYTPIGMIRHAAGEAMRTFRKTEEEVLQSILAEAITNPDFLKELMSRRAAQDANKVGRLIGMIGPRLAGPIAAADDISQQSADISPQ